MTETIQPTCEQIQEAREIFGPETVTLALMVVKMSDPDGAYTMLEDQGEDDAAEAVAFLYFPD